MGRTHEPPGTDVGEFANKEYAYLGNDEVPDTLIAALKHFAIDFVPESRAACILVNRWLDENRGTRPSPRLSGGWATASSTSMASGFPRWRSRSAFTY